MMYIDADNAIYGRLSTFVAKKLLEGEEIVIVNANRVAITVSRKFLLNRFIERRDIGSNRKGPYYPRTSNQILRRAIKNMLPVSTTRGKTALERCMVYASVPKIMKNKEFKKLEEFENRRVSGYVTLQEISKTLGYKVRE